MELMRKKSPGTLQPICAELVSEQREEGNSGVMVGIGAGKGPHSVPAPAARAQGMLRDQPCHGITVSQLEGSFPQGSLSAGSAQDTPTIPPKVPKGFYWSFFSAHLLWKSPPALNICHSLDLFSVSHPDTCAFSQFSWNSAFGDNLPLLHEGVCPILVMKGVPVYRQWEIPP